MAWKETPDRPVSGKTYSLFGTDKATDGYYRNIRFLTDLFLRYCPEKEKLLYLVKTADSRRYFLSRLTLGILD